jgi:hypothetical protein
MTTIRRAAVLAVAVAFAAPAGLAAQQWRNAEPGAKTNQSSFRPIEEWADPTEQRTAGGAPGAKYWQQRADYVIRTALDTVNHAVSGSERVTYHNNSPDALGFLWVQLDQNIESPEHSRARASQGALPEQLSEQARQFLGAAPFEGGHEISRVQLVRRATSGTSGAKRARTAERLVDADYVINGSVMKIHLPEPLKSGETVSFEIDWRYKVPDDGRGAKEKVKDGWLYEIAQWFPRMSVYDDVNGWQTDQFLGQGEFYLNFGNYDVSITVPADHIVDATGILQNPEQVLTLTQRQRLAKAYESETPVFIVRPEEVMTAASRPKTTGTLTWRFTAENVRDFAWVSSKTYVWDAAGYRYRPNQKPIALHSLYPRDAMPLWDSVSTKAIVQTMKTYGRMAFEYPYPKAVNVHGPVFGMEYPMIAFCGARPDPDGTYTEALARALISVTIHEVGHNWYPMIVASDERKHTWMDEGLNSFLQYYAEQDWQKGYPSRRGPAKNLVEYMRDTNQAPIMIHSDLIHRQFGNNGYAKPAAGLVMLREQILGPKLFDQAFQTYSKRWMFKHPQPADFFRSLEEGAGEDLAYFWRGWFYTTHHNDQAVAEVKSQSAQELIGDASRGRNYYRVKIDNKGGLVLPVKMAVTFSDGSTQRVDLPADIWRSNELTFTYGFFTDKTVTKVVLDPDEAMADVDTSNNTWSGGESPTT